MGVIGWVLKLVGVYCVALVLGCYTVKEGEVVLLKEFGVLRKELVEPGLRFRIPFYQEILRINLMIQTDIVKDVPCGTSNGLLVVFDRIEVINRLDKRHVYKIVLNYTDQYQQIWITDKVHHEINEFCSKHTLQEIYIELFDRLDQELMRSLSSELRAWAPGIQILSIRTTKPAIPKKILKNVEEMERIKVQYLIALEKEKVLVQESKTNQTQRRIAAQSQLSVRRIDLQKILATKRNALEIARIEAKIIEARERTLVETEFLAALQQASLYPQLLTPDYLRYLAIQALTSNLTLSAGDKVPSILPAWPNGLDLA